MQHNSYATITSKDSISAQNLLFNRKTKTFLFFSMNPNSQKKHIWVVSDCWYNFVPTLQALVQLSGLR